MRLFIKKNKTLTLAALGALVLLSACAARRAAVEHIAQADLAIRHTEQTDASRYASLEVHQAQEKLTLAKKAKEDGDYKESRQLSEEALVNTQLAQAKVLSGKTGENVKESKNSTETLRNETQRNRDARQDN